MKTISNTSYFTENDLTHKIWTPNDLYHYGSLVISKRKRLAELKKFHIDLIELVLKYENVNELLFEISKQNLRNLILAYEEMLPDYIAKFPRLDFLYKNL